MKKKVKFQKSEDEEDFAALCHFPACSRTGSSLACG
jgi:predicted RNase H-like HicB family nuclease